MKYYEIKDFYISIVGHENIFLVIENGGRKMKISLLNERIELQKSSVEVDNVGNHKNVWNKYYSCYATISSESPQEETSSGAIWDESKIDFTIRYSKEVSVLSSIGYRVIFQDDIYEIEGIDHMNYRKKSLKLHCKRCER